MPQKPCIVARCPNYATTGQSYCHEHLHQRPTLRLTGSTRPKGWQRIRQQALRAYRGRCGICGNPATTVHHKRSIYDNQPHDLIALCQACHDQAHAPSRRVA